MSLQFRNQPEANDEALLGAGTQISSDLAHAVIDRIGPVLAELEDEGAGPVPGEIGAALDHVGGSHNLLAQLCTFVAAPREYCVRELGGALLIERKRA
jgi:hypothetical protein